jgi:aconitate hydratase
MTTQNSFGARGELRSGGRSYGIYRLAALEQAGLAHLSRIPYSIKILLENLLRFEDGVTVKRSDIEYVAKWDPQAAPREINFRPARVLLQDFTGVPCVVDLAAMRDALAKLGADPKKANPLIPVDLVIDHSVQVDEFGTKGAFAANALIEFHRNQERYSFLRWGQSAFENFRGFRPSWARNSAPGWPSCGPHRGPPPALRRCGVPPPPARSRLAELRRNGWYAHSRPSAA